jgi:hypothetical protein
MLVIQTQIEVNVPPTFDTVHLSTDRIVLRVGTAPRGGPHSGMARGHTLRISESVLTCCCIVVTLAGNKSPVYSSGHCLDVGIDPLVSPSAPGFDEVAGA